MGNKEVLIAIIIMLVLGILIWIALSLVLEQESSVKSINESLVNADLTNWSGNAKQKIIGTIKESQDELPKLLRYPSDTISYYLYFCSENQERNVQKAFETISAETGKILSFRQTSDIDAGQIKIFCHDIPHPTIGGSAAPVFNSKTGQIKSGIVYLYNYNKTGKWLCDGYPVLEIHEILHALGFTHQDQGIMTKSNLIEACPAIDKEILEYLKFVYSGGEQGAFQEIPNFTTETEN